MSVVLGGKSPRHDADIASQANVEFSREESTMFQHNQRLLIDSVLDSTCQDSVVAHYLRDIKNRSVVGWWITSKYKKIYLF